MAGATSFSVDMGHLGTHELRDVEHCGRRQPSRWSSDAVLPLSFPLLNPAFPLLKSGRLRHRFAASAAYRAVHQ